MRQGDVNGNNTAGAMSRAQVFEDEKRRIIESCFGKKDEDDSCENPKAVPPKHSTPC